MITQQNGRFRIVWVALIGLALVLAACGGDGESGDTSESVETPTPETMPAESLVTPTAPVLATGPGLNVGAPGSGPGGEERRLPGCADPDATECPSPLPPDLDLTVSAQGAQIAYYSRYWDALTGADAGEAAILIQPSEKNKFPLKGTFEVSFADSAEAVLNALEGAEVTEWTAAALGAGKVATVLDEEADPPLAVVTGVFDTGDGRTVIFRLTATGQYSLDFHHDVYAAMLDSLTVGAE